jgi:hypothetical protein
MGPLVFFQKVKKVERGAYRWPLVTAEVVGQLICTHTVPCCYILAQCTKRVESLKIWIVPFPFELHCDIVCGISHIRGGALTVSPRTASKVIS